jgi:hypothetical protein
MSHLPDSLVAIDLKKDKSSKEGIHIRCGKVLSTSYRGVVLESSLLHKASEQLEGRW